MATSDPGAALVPFGFTGLESLVYAFLLGEPGATGYRIAQAIGKPVANTYKSIQSLQAKGAIVVEEGEARLCRAVPAEELLDRIAREFDRHRTEAKDTFAKIALGEDDGRVYSIRSTSQVIQRARQMLKDARQMVILAARADVIADLSVDIVETATRGVEVAVKCDADVNLPRVESYLATRDDDLLKHGSYFRLVVDGNQCLAGRFGAAESEADFLWSQSRVLSLLMHEGLAAEITVLAVAERIEDGAGPKRLARALTQIRTAGSIHV